MKTIMGSTAMSNIFKILNRIKYIKNLRQVKRLGTGVINARGSRKY